MTQTAEPILEFETKKSITRKRVQIQEEKAEAGALGVKTIPIDPEDIEMMFVGKMCDDNLRQGVRFTNRLSGFSRDYKNAVPAGTFDNLSQLMSEFQEGFSKSKTHASKIAQQHPLSIRFAGMRGFTPYALALIMSHIKNIRRFDKPGQLMIYSGIGCVEGLPVTKANINKIKELYLAQGKEFKGFNTILSGRMFVIVDSLLRAQGWFLGYYQRTRERLALRALNEKMIEYREVKGEEIAYMKGRKNYSLAMWTHNNAKRRCARILLHLIWEEWRKLRNLPLRDAYQFEYLGHDKKNAITLDMILKFDASVKITRKPKDEKKTDAKAKSVKKAAKTAKQVKKAFGAGSKKKATAMKKAKAAKPAKKNTAKTKAVRKTRKKK